MVSGNAGIAVFSNASSRQISIYEATATTRREAGANAISLVTGEKTQTYRLFSRKSYRLIARAFPVAGSAVTMTPWNSTLPFAPSIRTGTAV